MHHYMFTGIIVPGLFGPERLMKIGVLRSSPTGVVTKHEGLATRSCIRLHRGGMSAATNNALLSSSDVEGRPKFTRNSVPYESSDESYVRQSPPCPGSVRAAHADAPGRSAGADPVPSFAPTRCAIGRIS